MSNLSSWHRWAGRCILTPAYGSCFQSPSAFPINDQRLRTCAVVSFPELNQRPDAINILMPLPTQDQLQTPALPISGLPSTLRSSPYFLLTFNSQPSTVDLFPKSRRISFYSLLTTHYSLP